MPQSNRARRKRIAVVSDIHAGHRAGLCPPYLDPSAGDRWGKLRSTLWKSFLGMLQGKYDLCIVNGDSIDGDGKRSKGTELITTDRLKQAKMARGVLEMIDAKDFHFTYGTPYHTGMGEDYEDYVAEHFNAEIGGHEWAEINGRVIDFKHKVGGTSVPYGKGLAIQKDRLWNLLWSETEEQPKSDIFIRSHLHWYFDCGDHRIRMFQTPALQGQGSKFGGRQCSGLVHFGMLELEIDERGKLSWEEKVQVIEEQKRTTKSY